MSLLAYNTRRWNAMKERPSRISAAADFARRAFAKKALYEEISAETARHGHHVPWWVIPLIHERECRRGCENMECSIAQGSRWDQHSNIIPHTGPYHSFKEAAVASLLSIHNTNWTAAGALTFMELYNGPGYANRGIPSPYVWGGTDQYVKGKYVRDKVFDANFVDPQLGVAIMLRELMRLDPSISFQPDADGQDKVDRSKEISVGSTGYGSIAYLAHELWVNDIEPMLIYGVVIVAVAVISYGIYRIWKKKKGEINVEQS